MFALVDCNNFYASCERVFRPDLNGKPIVVLSNNDGCVIARSSEAKAAGIPMGAPAFKYKQVFREQQVHVFSSNYALYGDMNKRIMALLATFSPELEVYSIDEAFLRLKLMKDVRLEEYAEKIKRTIKKHTGIPVSVGIGSSKTLAKVASNIAKKFPERTRGIYVIDSDIKREKALRWTKINDVWGIGRRHAVRLEYEGVKNAEDFAAMSDKWVKKHMSVVGLRTKYELQGRPMINIEEAKAKQSIATTRTFEHHYSSYDEIKERVVTFAVSCAEKLRQQKSHCGSLLFFLRTDRFRNDQPQYQRDIVINLPFPTNSSIEIVSFAVRALNYIFTPGYQYRRAGVVLLNISPEAERQMTLFENTNPKHKALMKTMDRLNQSIGYDKVKLASQDPDRTWKMRQEKLSPCYTTKLKDVITVKSE